MNKTTLQILLAILLVIATPIALTALLPAKILLDILPIGATIFLCICYVPQIRKNYILKEKSVEGQSLLFWVFLNIALTFLLTNAYAIWSLFGTYGYLITETLNEGLALITLCQFMYYSKKAKKN
jgi:uncharacterized protein with PQ loop repeat